MAKTSMSVREMGALIGLKKVESYWLVKKNHFEVRVVAGKMRVMIESFEEWYAGQFHYKKVNGEPPGSKWADSTLSILEAAEMLGISDSTVYELIKRGSFSAIRIADKTRVVRESFEKWYSAQEKYPVRKYKENT